MTNTAKRMPWLLSAAMGAMLVLTSCTCTIKEEQQAMINQLRTDEKQLNADIAKAEGDRSKLTNELNSRQAEVRKCNEKKAFVQDKMARWPNIWPNWDPSQDVEQPMTDDGAAMESTTKKKK
jgi:outer membrane murein-binding lipoprotein Lpp